MIDPDHSLYEIRCILHKQTCYRLVRPTPTNAAQAAMSAQRIIARGIDDVIVGAIFHNAMRDPVCAAWGSYFRRTLSGKRIGIAILSLQKRPALDSFIKKDFRAADIFPIIVDGNQNAMRGKRK
jgi:hypothetical protein